MHSDDSTQTIFDARNSLNNPAIDTHDKFLDCEPSPTIYSKPTFVPTTPPTPVVLSTISSSYTHAKPILSPSFSNISNTPIHMTDDQLEHVFHYFIQLQQ